jgi:hypothetical protein
LILKGLTMSKFVHLTPELTPIGDLLVTYPGGSCWGLFLIELLDISRWSSSGRFASLAVQVEISRNYVALHSTFMSGQVGSTRLAVQDKLAHSTVTQTGLLLVGRSPLDSTVRSGRLQVSPHGPVIITSDSSLDKPATESPSGGLY